MRRRYTDQGAGTYVMNDDLTMSFGGSRLPSVAYSKNNSYICSEHYNRINGSLTSVTMNTGDTIWTMRKQLSRLLPIKVGSGKLETSLSCDLRGNVTVIDQNGALKEINNYYPYGGLMGGAVTGIQPDKYGGKELDRENGIDWYDFEARYQDPMLPMFTTQDPLAEQTPGISPYAYCAGNPIRYIDPTGMLWLKNQWGDDTYYMFDKSINSQSDIVTKYGKDTNLALVGDGQSYERIDVLLKDGDGFPIEDVVLCKDGAITVNGENPKQYENGFAHFSNVDNYVFASKDDDGNIGQAYKRNFFGTFYVGDHNPIYKNKYSYALPPINLLDYAAQLHDRDYDNLGCGGKTGALNPITIWADGKLALRSYYSVFNSDMVSCLRTESMLTGHLFAAIAISKGFIMANLYWLSYQLHGVN